MDPQKMTIDDLAQYAQGRFPSFEYWATVASGEYPIYEGAPSGWVVAYWIEGGSEGFFVHVDRIPKRTDKRQTLIFGKAMQWGDAMIAAAHLNAMLQGNPSAVALTEQWAAPA